MAGEFGNAFASGKVWSWLGGRVYTSGFDVPRIKDRFRWSLGPMPIGPIGEERHSWNDQPNLITNGAERLGNVEESVDLTVFLGGPVYQGRVAIDRGHMPMFKAVFDTPEAVNPPPEGMQWLKSYAEAPESRHLMMMLPNWWEMNEWRNAFVSAAFLGDVPVDEAIASSEKWVSDSLESQRDGLNKARTKFGFSALLGEPALATAARSKLPRPGAYAPGLGASQACLTVVNPVVPKFRAGVPAALVAANCRPAVIFR